MKKLYLAAVLLGCATFCFSQTRNSENIPPSKWQKNAENYLTKMSYNFQPVSENNFAAANNKQAIGISISGQDFSTYPLRTMQPDAPQNWRVGMKAISLRKENTCTHIEPMSIKKLDAGYLLFGSLQMDVEYLNDENGLRQNFIVREMPSGNGALRLDIKLETNLQPSVQENQKLVFKEIESQKLAMTYDKLLVWDAHKKPLSARMTLHSNILSLVVDDKNATYPITIDPLSHTPDFTASADAVLPGLLTNFGLQVNALLGYSVRGLGDVNGDGFDDVAIGAPGAIDIVAGNAIVDAGAVFVYFGSATGLPTQPDKVLRATTPLANALFGFSISAGNMVGDSKKDILIGAPGDSYTANVGGTPSTASVTAGKAYIFKGEDISAVGTPAPFLEIKIDGPAFFSNIPGSTNINVNALFGYALATTGDLDGDGFDDIVVGSPGYLAATILQVRTGAAFVFYSNQTFATPASLNTPTAAILGIATTDGLLFGFSVDGGGDFNKDGFNDIVVGAPGGQEVLTQIVGGSAYIYPGTGTNADPNYLTILKGQSSFLNAEADLFGFKVKGVRDVMGNRNGNILVSAPAGMVLSNVVNGLRLQSGAINVFLARTTPTAMLMSDQALSSPRANNLLTILAGETINLKLLFGADVDNAYDVNCDGFADIVAGEPLSTSVGLIGSNVVGGAAFIYTGTASGLYTTTAFWTLQNQVSLDFGVNAASLLGYSVAGLGYTRGATEGVSVMVGAPAKALDFSSGIFNLTGTFGTLFSFLATNNNVGKAYAFNFASCAPLPLKLLSFAAESLDCNIALKWKFADVHEMQKCILEKSEDGINFFLIKSMSKNSSGLYNYDTDQGERLAYYRLKIVEETGNFYYSHVVMGQNDCKPKEQLSVMPNPVRNNAKIRFVSDLDDAQAIIIVRNVRGQIVSQLKCILHKGENSINADTRQWPTGQLYLQIKTNNKRYNSDTIIKL